MNKNAEKAMREPPDIAASDEEPIVYTEENVPNADWLRSTRWSLGTDRDHFRKLLLGGPGAPESFRFLPAYQAPDKPEWVEIPEDVPRYDAHPPGFGPEPSE